MMNTEIRGMKFSRFDGKDSTFSNGWAMFSAYSEVNGFGEALTETKPRHLKDKVDDLDHSDSTKPDAVNQYRANALAMANLTMAFTNENSVCIGYVSNSTDADWPKRQVWVIFEKLFKRFRSNDLMVGIELTKKLSEMQTKVDQLAQIDNWYPKALAEEKVLPALMMALPKASYRMVVSQLARLLKT